MAEILSERLPLLNVKGIVAGYGPIEVLHSVSLSVNQGEVVTLIGANGAGKSSLLMSISGLLSVAAGEIAFAGSDMVNIQPAERVRAGIVQVPEGRRIFPRLTVAENLELGAYLRDDLIAKREELEQVFELFPILKERLRQLGGTLSGGEQQMLAIGRALMSSPKLLMMDEPSMGVAPKLVEKIFQTIRDLNARGITILLVEQNAHLALNIAHRAYVMEVGKISLSGTAAELKDDERVRKAYLGG